MTSSASFSAEGPSGLHAELLKLSRELGGPLLALDTSSSAASVCRVAWGTDEVHEATLAAIAQPSELIGQTLADAVQASGIAMRALKAVVVGVGPGSFTGLRVGLAMAKGLGYAAHVPLYGVSSLAMLAASQGPGRVALSLEARRGEIFAAVYDVTEVSAKAVVDDMLTTPESFSARLTTDARLVGDVAIGPRLPEPSKPMRAAFGVLLAAARLRTGAADDLSALVPSYLKVSEAERMKG